MLLATQHMKSTHRFFFFFYVLTFLRCPAFHCLLQYGRVDLACSTSFCSKPVFKLPVSGLNSFSTSNTTTGPHGPLTEFTYRILLFSNWLGRTVSLNSLTAGSVSQFFVTDVFALLAFVSIKTLFQSTGYFYNRI